MQERRLQLPYPAPFPQWSKYHQPAVTSRPFLTVDDKFAHLSPRLFPIQLAASLILPPPPKNNNNNSGNSKKLLTSPQPSSQLIPSPSSSYSITNNNNLCVVPDSSSKTPLIAATPDASLEHLAIYQLDARDEFVKNSVVRCARRYRDINGELDTWKLGNLNIRNNIDIDSNVISADTMRSTVCGVQAVECDDDGGLLLASLADSLCIGRYNSGGKELVWVDHISIPNLRATDVNRVALTEFAAVDNFSLKLYDIATAACTLAEDVQPISPKYSYRWVQYGAHPRTVLVASKRAICRFDLRQSNSNRSDEILVNPVDAWNLCPKVDVGISYFEKHPNNPFMTVLATGTVLAVVDARMAGSPLLEWNITYGNDISNAALMPLNDNTNDLAIALSAKVTSDLALFHLTSDFKVSAEEILLNPQDPANFRRFQSDLNDTGNSNYNKNFNDINSDSDDEDGPVVSHPHILWSDMPLVHLEQFPPGNELRGIALLPEPQKGPKRRKFSLVQSSPRYGITAQRVGCEKFKDGTYAFEAPLRDSEDEDIDTAEKYNLLYGMDSAVDMLNARDALLVEAEGPETAEKIIQQAVEPGLRMVKRLKCLDTRDVLAVRQVLDGGGELDADMIEDEGDRSNKKKRKLQ